MVDVLFELADALGAEGVRDGLALSRMLCSIPRVEETSLNGHESIVIFPIGHVSKPVSLHTREVLLTTLKIQCRARKPRVSHLDLR